MGLQSTKIEIPAKAKTICDRQAILANEKQNFRIIQCKIRCDVDHVRLHTIFWLSIFLECKRNTKVFRRKIKAKKNIRISCCITGQTFSEITWYKDENELNIPHGSTVINNVRYQQKGARLLISRTDVHGSGYYQCLARNSAGDERGGMYQVIFYGKIFSS